MISKAKQQAVSRYKKKAYKRIGLDVRNEFFEAMLPHVEKSGESVNGYIKRAILERMERDEVQ